MKMAMQVETVQLKLLLIIPLSHLHQCHLQDKQPLLSTETRDCPFQLESQHHPHWQDVQASNVLCVCMETALWQLHAEEEVTVHFVHVVIHPFQ